MLSSLSTQEQQAVAYFNKKISEGDIHTQPVWVDGFSQSIFLDMPQNGEVIDVGCGIGRSISMLPDLGITCYFGIDPAESQVAYCKKTYPQFNFELNEISGVRTPIASMDFCYSQSCNTSHALVLISQCNRFGDRSK
jgi:SAM-dependent methyltransferase